MSTTQTFLFFTRRCILVVFSVLFCLILHASCDKSSIVKESETPDVTINSGTVVRNYYETQDEILALIDNETESSNLITQSYDIDLLRYKEYSTSLEEIDEIARIECIRKVDDLIYSIHKINEGGELFLFYKLDEESKSWITCGSWYFLEHLHREDFSKVEFSKTNSYDIAEIDPTVILYPTGDGNYSKHILTDRSVVLIYYDYYDDNDYIVKSIEYGDEWVEQVYKKILDIDWPT